MDTNIEFSMTGLCAGTKIFKNDWSMIVINIPIRSKISQIFLIWNNNIFLLNKKIMNLMIFYKHKHHIQVYR